jgi:hypothetical protein
MGALNPGDSVLLVGDIGSEEMALKATMRALEERKIKAEFKYDFEMVGVTKPEMLAYLKATGRGDRSKPTRGWSVASAEHGYQETAGWVRSIVDENGKPVGEEWLKKQNPTLYAKLFPRAASAAAAAPVQLPPELAEVRRKLTPVKRSEDPVAQAILKYLADHKMRGVFMGTGGPIWLDFPGQEGKWLGLLTQDSEAMLATEQASYPADIWMLAEEQTLDPIAFVERGELTDPEGTNLWFDLTAEQAARWAKAVFGIRGVGAARTDGGVERKGRRDSRARRVLSTNGASLQERLRFGGQGRRDRRRHAT